MIQLFQDDNDEIVEVFCSSADYTQSSSQCKNLGGSEVLDQANYASRRVKFRSILHCKSFNRLIRLLDTG